MKTAELIEKFSRKWKYLAAITPKHHKDFKSELTELLKETAREAYPDKVDDKYVFCGKCGTAI